MKRLLPGITIQPPGYTSVRSLANVLKGAGTFMLNVDDWDEIVEGRYAIVGSPETVTAQLDECIERLGVGNLLGLFQLGSLPADLTTPQPRAVRERRLAAAARASSPKGRGAVSRPAGSAAW